MSAQRIVLPIAADHPAFAGHFPGRPVVPGVILLDEALLAIGDALGTDLSACSISSAKFLHPATPGERLELQYEVAADGSIRFGIFNATGKIASAVLSTLFSK